MGHMESVRDDEKGHVRGCEDRSVQHLSRGVWRPSGTKAPGKIVKDQEQRQPSPGSLSPSTRAPVTVHTHFTSADLLILILVGTCVLHKADVLDLVSYYFCVVQQSLALLYTYLKNMCKVHFCLLLDQDDILNLFLRLRNAQSKFQISLVISFSCSLSLSTARDFP